MYNICIKYHTERLASKQKTTVNDCKKIISKYVFLSFWVLMCFCSMHILNNTHARFDVDASGTFLQYGLLKVAISLRKKKLKENINKSILILDLKH